MRDGVFLVNTARGAIINEEALIAALESGKVARAGLDVFSSEPNINPYFTRSDKVIVQPHLGGLTDFAFHKAEKEALENIRAFFARASRTLRSGTYNRDTEAARLGRISQGISSVHRIRFKVHIE